MATKLIKLKQDGILVEVEAQENETRAISGGAADKVDSAMDKVKPIILKACKPVIEVWGELNKDLSLEQVEIELGLGFEAEGNLFVTKATGSANLTIKLTLKPKSAG